MNTSTNVHGVASVRPFIVCLEASSATVQLGDGRGGRHEVTIFAGGAPELRARLLELEAAAVELRLMLDEHVSAASAGTSGEEPTQGEIT